MRFTTRLSLSKVPDARHRDGRSYRHDIVTACRPHNQPIKRCVTGLTLIAMLAIATHVSAQSPAPSAPPGPTVLLIPFAPPDNKDDKLVFATEQLHKKLVAHDVAVVDGTTMDLLDVSGAAGDLCQKFHAVGILAGTVRHEQNRKFLTGTMATHAEVRVTRFDCAGKSVWKGFAVGDKDYAFANPNAAISDVIQQALDSIIVQYLGSLTVTK